MKNFLKLLSRGLTVLFSFPFDLWLRFVTTLPGYSGYALRICYWRSKLKHLGRNVRIEPGVSFLNPRYISVADHCWIDRNCLIIGGVDSIPRERIVLRNSAYSGEPGEVAIGRNIHIGPNCIVSGAGGGLSLGDDCGLSANCRIYALSHHYRSRERPSDRTVSFGPLVAPERQCVVVGPVTLGRNTGLALNSVVLPGACIAEDCFVSINSVVFNGRFKPNTILSGNPATAGKDRFPRDPGSRETGEIPDPYRKGFKNPD